MNSAYFGALPYDPGSVFHFVQDMPGLPDQRVFAPVEIPSQYPLLYLQSLTQSDLCLMALPVLTICPGYELRLSAEDRESIGFSELPNPRIGEDLLCLAIVAVEENADATANLLAPVVVNLQTRAALQAIQFDSAYSCRHELSPACAC